MKLAKLSLAAIVVAGLASSSFAASTTLADAFKNGKVKGELKAWYFDKTSESATGDNNENITNVGLTLGYITDSFYGLRMGATFQGSSTPFIDSDQETAFKDHMAASGAVLSEAYLGYTLGKTDVKIGRQFISTPLVSGSGSRFFKESFEGVTVVNTDIPQTTLVAGYVSKFQGRTSNVSGQGLGDAPTFEKLGVFNGAATLAFDGAYTAAVINKSVSNLTLTAQYAIVKDVNNLADTDVFYTEANYVLPLSGFKLGFDLNYRGSRTDTALDFLNYEGNMLAGRVSVKDLAGFGASFAAAQTSSSDNVILGMGNGTSSYTGSLIQGSAGSTATADTNSYKFQIDYDFSKVGVAGLKALAQYQWTNQGHSVSKTTGAQGIGTDYTSIAGGVYYAVPYLKGLTTGLEYETREADNGTTKLDADELWFKAGYKF